MTEATSQANEDISLFSLGTMLVRERWRVARWMLGGGILAGLMVFSRQPMYTATASFAPQGFDASRSGLSGLAGQFGVSLAAGNQTLSPDFYAKLLKSRAILIPMATDSVVVTELGGKRTIFLDLFSDSSASQSVRDEQFVQTLANMIGITVGKTTGIVEVSVATQWRSVSLGIATQLVDGINEYNQRTRQGQAVAERKFVEGRLEIARAELRDAEDRMENFLRTNRDGGQSPAGTTTRERIQRDLTLKQQVFTSLTQAYEDVRIREVRDTPVITIVDPPSVRTIPEPRGRLKSVILGILVGGLISALLIFVSGIIEKRRREDPDADQFMNTLREALTSLLRPFKQRKARV